MSYFGLIYLEYLSDFSDNLDFVIEQAKGWLDLFRGMRGDNDSYSYFCFGILGSILLKKSSQLEK